MTRMRLQNYTAYDFKTEDEWSALFAGDMAPTRVRVPSRRPIAWTLRVASVQDLRVAYGAHASDIEIDQFGSGEGLHIHIPQSGCAELTVDRSTTVASNRQAILVDFSRPHCLKMQGSPGYTAIALNIPKRLIDAQFSALSGHAPRRQIEFDLGLSLASAAGGMLSSLAEALVSGLESGLLAGAPIAMTNLSQAVLGLLVQAGPHRLHDQIKAPVLSVAPRHVKRAIDYMHANIGRPLTSAEIASAVNVSVRSLEVGFRTFRQTTPMAYLRSVRLAAAREELSLPNNMSTVAEIAFRWGFGHLGRFSATYRNAYGELPSETIARCID